MFPVNKKLIDRLHREGAFDYKPANKRNAEINIDFASIVGLLLRESPFLFVGLGALSILKNNTDIPFWFVILVSISIGICSRLLMSKLVQKANVSPNKFFRVMAFLLLASIPFLLVYGLLTSVFSVNGAMTLGLVTAVSILISAIVEFFIFEQLS